MSSESKPSEHDVFELSLVNENGEAVLQATLHLHEDQALGGDAKGTDEDIAYICDSSFSSPCLYNHAFDLGILKSEADAQERKLKFYYPITITSETEDLSFNILLTEIMDHTILNKSVTLKAGKVEVEEEVLVNSKKCKVVVERKKPKGCNCTRKLSRTHCVRSRLL